MSSRFSASGGHGRDDLHRKIGPENVKISVPRTKISWKNGPPLKTIVLPWFD